MPSHKQDLSFPGQSAGSLLNLAYGTVIQLGWAPRYSGDNTLVAYTSKSWMNNEHEIFIETDNNILAITSSMVHGESFDMMGKNKKSISEFITAFEQVKTSQRETNQEWGEALEQLRQQTVVTAAEEAKKATEVDKAMNLSSGNLYFTYGIITINILVFIAMIATGISFISPSGYDIIKWGANYAPLTFSGDWWRLISCVFVHIGIIHLLFNMYALYSVSVYLEPMLGKSRYIIAYLCTGVFASIVSLWWHKTPVASAGASGAVFGMYGVFLAFLSTNLIPKQIRNSLLQGIGIFIAYNLVYGMKSGVDNAAHVGGLLSGLVIGFLYYRDLKNQGQGNKKTVIVLAVAGATLAATLLYLSKNKVSRAEREQVNNILSDVKFGDGERFNEKYNEFIEMQNKALEPLNDTSLTNEQLAIKLKEVSIPEWNKAEAIISEVQNYNVSDNSKKKIELMKSYVALRKEQVDLIQKMIAGESDQYAGQYAQLVQKLEKIVNEMDQL